MANDTATVTQTVNSVTVEQPPQSSITVTETSGGSLTLSETTGTLTAVNVSPLSSTLTIESEFADLNSPNFTGIPTAPTASPGTNTTQIATTAFVNSAVSLENSLSEMEDVNFASLGDNELLQYDSSSSKWKNQTIAEIGLATTSSLSAHANATNNPHGVTATQVNLGNVTNESKATMFSSPAFTGTPTAPTVTSAGGVGSNQIATTAYVRTEISNLVDGADAGLDTLLEIATSLNNDDDLAGTLTTSIATKLSLSGGTMTGDITMSGSETVDGRDLSVDGAKLDDIEPNATADQTAAEILTELKTVDGAGSGLDADTLDGSHASTFAAASDLSTHVGATNPHNITASTVGLGNVNNTSDVNKPISSATQTALNAKASTSALTTHTGATNNPHSVTATQVGLGNVTNESKATMFTSAALTGTPTAPTASAGTNTTQIATTEFVNAAVALENTLAEMDDVVISSLADGELLQYNSGLARWINVTPTEAGILPLAGGTMTGNLTLSYAYPRINLTDTNHDSDYSIINNDGAFSIFDVTNASHRLSIAANGNATFAGNLTVGDGHFIGDDSFDNLTLISSSGENVVIASANDIYLKTDASGGGTGTNRLVINETGATFDGIVTIPDGAANAPSLRTASHNSGLFTTSGTLQFSVDGVARAYISNAGITSNGNVYTSATGQFRNFSGVWKATTGTTGNGFQFTNTADSVDSMTISSAGNVVAAGTITGTRFIQSLSTGSYFYAAEFGRSNLNESLSDMYGVGDTLILGADADQPTLVIRDTEKVGIGTASPVEKLEVAGNIVTRNGTTATKLNLYETYSDSYNYELSFFRHASSFLEIGTEALGTGTASGLKLKTAGADRITVLSGGQVGINTTTVPHTLSVKGTISRLGSTGIQIINLGSSGDHGQLTINNSGGTTRVALNSNGDASYINAGNFGIGVTAPSQKLEVGTNTDVSAQIGRAHIGNVSFGDHAGFSHLDAATSSGYALLQSSSGDTFLNSPASRHIYFRKGNATIGGFNGNSDFYVDTDTLYVDASEDRVGINVNDPDATLEIKSTGTTVNTEAFRVRNANNTELFRIQDNGVVVVPSQYFYAASSGGAYVQHDLRVRGSLSNDQGTLVVGGDVNFDSNTLFVDSSDNRVGIGTNSPAAPLSLVGVNGGSWNDGLIIDDPTGWAATVYKRSNSPKMFTGLYSGNDNYIWMSTGYSNSGTTITAPRADAVLMARPSTDDLQIYLETHFGNNVGIATTAPTCKLQVDEYTVGSNGNQDSGIATAAIFTNSGSDGLYLGVKNASYPNRGYSFKVTSNGVNSDFTIREHGSTGDRFTIQTGGNVGIGTTSPQTSLQVSKLDATSAITIHRDGSNPSTNTSLGKIIFAQDYNGTQQNAWGQIDLKTNASSVRTDMAFKVKSTGGNEMTAMTLHGTSSDGPRVGIGIATPPAILTVRVDGNANTDQLRVENSSGRLFSVDNEGDVKVHGNLAMQDNAKVISARKISARDANGLHLTEDGGATGISISDGGNTSIQGALTVVNNSSFTANLTVPSESKLFKDATINSTNDATIVTASNDTVLFSNPVPRVHHDLLAFNSNITQESHDGTSWSSSNLFESVFDNKEDNSVTVISSSQNGVRWTVSGFAYTGATHVQINTTYSTGTGGDFEVTIESSSDGTNWTQRCQKTISIAARCIFLRHPYLGGDSYGRITIYRSSGTRDINVSNVRWSTNRAGDQGQGREYEFPYDWNYLKSVKIPHYLHVGNDLSTTMSSSNAKRLVVGDGYGAEGITIYSGHASGGYLYFANGTTGDASYRGAIQYSHSTDGLSFHTAGTATRMFINSTGGVGLGTSSVNTDIGLQVDNGHLYVTSGEVKADNINAGYFSSTRDLELQGGSAAGVKLMSGSATVLHTKSDGKVGINTTTDPTVNLDIEGASNVIADLVTTTANANTTIRFREQSAAAEVNKATIGYDGTNDGLILTTGGFTAGNGIFIDDNQKVGIGTFTPSQKLDIAAGWIELDTAYGIQWGGTANRIWGSGGNNYIKIETNGVERLRVDGQGDVGIGVTDPDYKLHVNGAIAIKGGEVADTARIHFQASDESNRFTLESDFNSTTTTDLLGFRSTTADNILVLKGNGNVGIGTTSPVEELTCRGNIGIYGATSGGAVTETPSLHFYTSEASAGFSTATSYDIGEISWSGKDGSLNAAGKYASIETKLIDGNSEVQGTQDEGGQLDFNIYRHDVSTQARVKHTALRIDNFANVGIGTAGNAIDQKLHVKGDALRIEESVNSRHLDIVPAVSGQPHKFTSTSTGSGYRFENSSGVIAALDANQSVFYQDVSIAASNLLLSSAHYVQFGNANVRIQGSNAANYLRFFTGGTKRFEVANATATFTTDVEIGGNLTISGNVVAPNAPTNLNLSVVGETINVTFTASTTSNIDAYLVYSSVDGSDYGLISIIPPDDFGATMSIIDSAFTVTGTQAYRVYAVKAGKLSSALSGNISYTVSSAEPTNLSVVPLNNAFYIQYDPPSSNSRFVTAYKIYKHEHSNQSSLSRSSATEIYSGMNKSYMYQISGSNNTNFHQFWVETTIAT